MRVKPAVLLFLVALTPIGASPQPLNPLVPRLANEAIAPPECAEGAAPRSEPRILVTEIPMPEPEAELVASTALPRLGGLFRDLQTAIARDDRRLFDASLTRLRTALADYPSGSEKTSALAAARAYEDVARLWDAQFESPFFSEDSDAYRAASAYPGWSEAVRRNVLVDDRDRRFYPARESRQYLAGIATRATGGRASTAVATNDDDEEPSRALPSVKPKRWPSKIESHTATNAPATSRRRTATTRIASSSPPSTRRTSPPPVSSPEPARSEPPRATSSPITEPAPATTTTEPPPAADPEPQPPAPITLEPTTTTIAPESPTTTSAAPATTTTAATPATPDRSRRLIVPLILILVGIGVLIVLVRAST
jgi:hypothetical protein